MDTRLSSELQNFLNQVDSGFGQTVIRWLLMAFFAFSAAALYLYMNFQGLRSPPIMEAAQLARNIAEGRGFSTDCIRPLALGRIAGEWPHPSPQPHAPHPQLNPFPDLTHPPLYPLALAGLFRLTGLPTVGRPHNTTAYPWDYVPVTFNAFCFALAFLWIIAIGRRLFDLRCALLAASSWLLTAAVWNEALLGAETALALFFSLGAIWAAIRAAESPSPGRYAFSLSLAAAFTTAAFHTCYASATLALPLFLFLGFTRRPHAWPGATLYLLLSTAAALPWILRNLALCHAPFGLAPCALLADTYLYPGDCLARTLSPSLLGFLPLSRALETKIIENLRLAAPLGFGLGSLGLLGALACAQFLHRFHRPSSHALRFCLLPAVPLLLLCAAASATQNNPRPLQTALLPLWPLLLLYAWAFALTLLDRIPFPSPLPPALAIGALLLLGAIPYALHVLPPRSGRPYPPYYHNHIAWAASLIAPDETLTTDVPWATAWYGGKSSLLLPRNLDSFYKIHRQYTPLSLAYFTLVTRDKPWTSAMVDPQAPDHDWYRIFSELLVPPDFPLPEARTFFNNDQMILVDHPRW